MKYENVSQGWGIRKLKSETRNHRNQNQEPEVRKLKPEIKNQKPETRNSTSEILPQPNPAPPLPPHSVGLWFWLVTEWLVNPESLSRGRSALAQKMKIYCIWKFQTKKKGMFILIFYLQIDMASCKSGKD